MDENQQQPEQPIPAPEIQPIPGTQAAASQPTPEPTPEPPAAQAPAQQAEQPVEAATPASEAAPAAAPAKPAPKTLKFPEVNIADWDNKTVELDKVFYGGKGTFSPRAFGNAISMPADLIRARQAVEKAGYQVAEGGSIMDNGGKFLATLMVEVSGVDPEKKDPNLLKFEKKQFHAKVVDGMGKVAKAKSALESELGKKLTELHVMHVIDAADKKHKQILLAN